MASRLPIGHGGAYTLVRPLRIDRCRVDGLVPKMARHGFEGACLPMHPGPSRVPQSVGPPPGYSGALHSEAMRTRISLVDRKGST